MTGNEYDYVGYANRLPTLEWPGGNLVAVSIVFNYEEGSERSIAVGDATGETLGEWGAFVPAADNARNRSVESFFEYGSRVGVWRLLDIVNQQQAKATVFACAVAFERNPAVARAFVEGGHEICGHGYRWEEHGGMSHGDEHERIRMAMRSFEATTGTRPVGWFVNNGVTDNTRRILVEEGFLYDCNSYSEDLPYFVKVGDRDHLIIPYAADTNDVRFWTMPGFVRADDWYNYLKATLDQLLSEAIGVPKLMSIGLHMRISGRPARAEALKRFIEYAKSRPGVWFARRDEIARFWLKHGPRSK